MNKPDPVDPSPNESCPRKKYDLNGTPPGYFAVPDALVDKNRTTAGEGRLSATLRNPLKAAFQLAAGRQALSLLIQSVNQFLANNTDLGNAFADLAVSGRMMYDDFSANPPTDAQLKQAVGGNATGLDKAVKSALDRAYGVAAALRNDLQTRLNWRDQFQYIAVSGEDDPPHRPVNCLLDIPDTPGMPGNANFAQFEIPV